MTTDQPKNDVRKSRRKRRRARARMRRRQRSLGTRILRVIGTAIIVLILLPILAIPIYAVLPPPASTLMLVRWSEGHGIRRDWQSLDGISTHLVRAVLSSEDSRFCEHRGVDWQALELVIDDLMEGERPRGASTVTMQLVKNLLLWPDRSYIRKGLEVPLALYGDLVWSKRRTMELYLNNVEWGRGIYGAEAAAKFHFGVSARSLNARQSALLATALPNPLARNPARPSAGHDRLARRVIARARQSGKLYDCVLKP